MGKISSGNKTSSAGTHIDGMSEFEEFVAIFIDTLDKDRDSNGKSIILSSLWNRHLCTSLQLLKEGREHRNMGRTFLIRCSFRSI